MKRQTRFVSVLLFLTLLLSLPVSGILRAQESGTICFAFQDVSTEFWVASHAAIIGALEGQGYEVVQLNGGQDANRQLEQIRDCIAQDGESGTTIVAEAQEADIPIATFNRPPADTSAGIVVVADNRSVARQAVEFMAQKALGRFEATGEKLNPLILVVTQATLVAGRGLGTAITESHAIDYPRSVLDFGVSSLAGIPVPIIIFALVVMAANVVLTRTQFGRRIYAVGIDTESAKKAGINTDRIIFSAYVVSGICAALGGFVLIAQIGRLTQPFGEGKELEVIAAAVLGGTSLFGGIGSAFGPVIGSALIQMVQIGLVFTAVNIYLQPMIQAVTIFSRGVYRQPPRFTSGEAQASAYSYRSVAGVSGHDATNIPLLCAGQSSSWCQP